MASVNWKGQVITLPPGAVVNADGSIQYPGARSASVPGTPEYDQSIYALLGQQYAKSQTSDPTGQMYDALTWQHKNEPGFQVPTGMTTDDNGNVIYDQGSWLSRNLINLIAGGALGVAGLGALGAFGGGAGGASGAGGAGLSGGGSIGLDTVGAGGAGAGGAGTAGTSGILADLPGSMTTLPSLDGAAGTGAFDAAGNFIGDSTYNVPTGGISGSGLSSAAKNLAPILGGASGQQASGEANQALLDMKAAELNAALPSQRLSSAAKAGALLTAKPYQAQWGGPGSGLRGQVVNFSGGPDPTKLPASVRALANSVMQDELNQQLAGPLKPKIGQSTGDKILGGAATGAGLIGALGPLFGL